MGDKYIHEVNEEDILVFKEWCKNDAKLKLQSLDDRLGPISGLLKYAQKNGHFPKGVPVPTEGMFELTKGQRDNLAIGAEPFSIEELQKIFEPKSYLKYANGYMLTQ